MDEGANCGKSSRGFPKVSAWRKKGACGPGRSAERKSHSLSVWYTKFCCGMRYGMWVKLPVKLKIGLGIDMVIE